MAPPLDAFRLDDKVAIVTGAGSGIGEATARLFAAAGAKLVLADLNGDEVRRVADDLAAQTLAVEVDVADEAAVKGLVTAAMGAFGRIDVLANVAADRSKADFMDVTAAEWDRMLAVNTRGPFFTMRECIQVMRGSGGGVIVNVSSCSARRPTIFGNAHYEASKAGLDALTRTVAVEFAGEGIRVNSVLPGGTLTPGMAKIRAGGGAAAKGPITVPGRVPMNRRAEPIEIARAILFLASPASSYITGQELLVDGGFSVS